MSSPSILIIGNGQLGSAFKAFYGEGATQIGRAEIDFATATESDFFRVFGRHQPKVVINTAAYTLVDKAEEERELAAQINGAAVGQLARACKEYGALLVHFSTDYVFNGRGEEPWKETDAPSPINWYGATKLRGEQLIQQSGCNHLIFRISWVYDDAHHNFLNTMLRLAAEREELSVVKDQIGAPCYAADIAKATKQVIEADAPFGIYHMCNAGSTSWHGFAGKIFASAKEHGQALTVQEVRGISSHEYPTAAARPHNSRLDCTKLEKELGITLPSWEDGLKRCMGVKYKS